MAARRPTSASPHEGIESGLQIIEVAALSTAALVQVAVLMSTAGQAQRRRPAAVDTTALALTTQGRQQHQPQQARALAPQVAVADLAAVLPAPSALAPLQGFALVVAVMCSAILRRLQGARALLRGSPTVDAAARLLRLEGELQQQAAAAALASRQLDKLQARVRLSTADLKSPIRQLQDAGAAQADVAVRLAEQQSALARQVSGLEEVVAALQGVGARQFQVCIDALGVLKQQHATTAERHIQQLVKVQQQVAVLSDGMARVQAQLPQQQQPYPSRAPAGIGAAVRLNGNGKGGVESSAAVHTPDPWLKP